jgi:hypothetical protein
MGDYICIATCGPGVAPWIILGVGVLVAGALAVRWKRSLVASVPPLILFALVGFIDYQRPLSARVAAVGIAIAPLLLWFWRRSRAPA